MAAPQKRVAVIGGGFSGFGSIRSLKEVGIEPVCYEKSPFCGGTWHYHEEELEGMPSIMWTTTINHSKEMGALSDFPPPKEWPNYMKHSQMYEFFVKLGKHYDLFKHVTCNREVIQVNRTEDYEATGRWTVTVKNTETGEITNDVFDGVMVCVGHITHPKMPEFPGMDKFKGRIMHTHSLKKVDVFAGQRIVVVGIGCSALDAAVETSSVAQQVYLSTRSGAWIIPRVGPYGYPIDWAIIRRCVAIFLPYLPLWLASKYVEWFFLNPKFSHKMYNIQPKCSVLGKDPSVNDGLPAKLLSGAVVLRKNIHHFTENGVVFDGEDEVTDADTVIMGTGYKWQFPFLEQGIVVQDDGVINLYKCMYPPHLKHPTLTIIGFLLPLGPGFPLGEMQCRWAAHLLSGQGSLPSQEIMMEEIKKRHDYNVKRYPPSDKMSIRIDFVQYMDDLASEIGVKPNLLKIAFTDPKLFLALFFGPFLSYQYRLEGPHKWSGARETIMTAGERMRAPLKIPQKDDLKKQDHKKQSMKLGFVIKYVITLLLMSFWISWKDSSVKYLLVALILPYVMTFRGFFTKYILVFVSLPFLITFNYSMESYLATLLMPIIVSAITTF